jgi:hypothetical protein
LLLLRERNKLGDFVLICESATIPWRP